MSGPFFIKLFSAMEVFLNSCLASSPGFCIRRVCCAHPVAHVQAFSLSHLP
jgi:hypothetical protein